MPVFEVSLEAFDPRDVALAIDLIVGVGEGSQVVGSRYLVSYIVESACAVHRLDFAFQANLAFGVFDAVLQFLTLEMEGFAVEEDIECLAGLVEWIDGHTFLLGDLAEEGLETAFIIVAKPLAAELRAVEFGQISRLHAAEFVQPEIKTENQSLVDSLVFISGIVVAEPHRVG